MKTSNKAISIKNDCLHVEQSGNFIRVERYREEIVITVGNDSGDTGEARMTFEQFDGSILTMIANHNAK